MHDKQLAGGAGVAAMWDHIDCSMQQNCWCVDYVFVRVSVGGRLSFWRLPVLFLPVPLLLGLVTGLQD
jgi:hypothetical protein